jgi:ABC-type spermidine/putrescine transport system permease subunit I
MDLPLAFILAIAGLLNSVVLKWVQGHGFSNGILPSAIHVVLELVHAKVQFFVLGILKGVVDIDRVQGLYDM